MKTNRQFKIRILGCDYELRPGDPAELRGRWGFLDFQKRFIVYASHLEQSAVKEAVFHELLHASDLPLSTNKNELTEEQVERVSAVLFSILRDHSHLVDWLMNDENNSTE